MREKPANEDAVKRMIGFLSAVKDKTTDETFTTSCADLQKNFQTSRLAFSSIKFLKVVEPVPNSNKFKWNDDFQPGRKLALMVLDNILHKNKKVKHVPLMPEFATAVSLLAKISDKLDVYTLQQENILKRLKQPSNELPAIMGETLFSEADQYHKDFVYLAGQVSSSAWDNVTVALTSKTDVDLINRNIMHITTDLLTKINNLKTTKNGQQ
jgi:hypothetical protein